METKIPYSYYNPNILSRGGRIGRLYFIRNKLLIYFASYIGSFFYLKLLFFVPEEFLLISLKTLDWVSILIIIYFLRINDFKRMRDIYNRESSTLSSIALFIFFTNPLGEIISLLVLPFIHTNARAITNKNFYQSNINHAEFQKKYTDDKDQFLEIYELYKNGRISKIKYTKRKTELKLK